jgi:hypothetical protein
MFDAPTPNFVILRDRSLLLPDNEGIRHLPAPGVGFFGGLRVTG